VRLRHLGAALLLCVGCAWAHAGAPLVLLTDFGTSDGAVSAMKGVAYTVSPQLLISDLSHENPDIMAATSTPTPARGWPQASSASSRWDRRCRRRS